MAGGIRVLKIRDNVDLKKLEKFGFKKDKNIYYYKNVFGVIVLRIFDNRKISNPTDDNGNVLLYDLIKADLVEKVDDKK